MDGTKDFFERNYHVKSIDMKTAKDYIIKHHYTHGCHNAPYPCYGLFEGQNLIGVLMFARPCSENVCSSIWGRDERFSVTELHRLHILDVTPRNTETWFMHQCFELMRHDCPEIKGIISFADSTEGHCGTIYKAMNFYYIGRTVSSWFYRDPTGRLRHPRQNGVNISVDEAAKRGWTRERRAPKNRYLYFLASNKREKKGLIDRCHYDLLHKEWCPICGKAHPRGSVCKCQRNKQRHELEVAA